MVKQNGDVDGVDDIDEEEIWDGICRVAAKRAGVSVESAKAILAEAGYHAYGHAGIVEAVEVVAALRPGREKDQ
jgi:hypothetical protein